MHNLLTKILTKWNIQSPDELSSEEQTTFKTWQAVLSKDELTLDDIKTFCQMQLDVIDGKWNDLSLEDSRKAQMIPYYTVYKNILSAINSPRSSREALEKHLINLTQ
jgi:hypothetical protein